MSSVLHPVPVVFAKTARIKADEYRRIYAESLANPEDFWSAVGRRLDWSRPYTVV